jgi:hypothetical protein
MGAGLRLTRRRRGLGPVLGARELQIVGLPRKTVIVRLGKPRKQPTREWACPFQVTGLGQRGVQHGYGEDGIQAVGNALQGIRVALDRSRTNLAWVGGEAGWTGFERSIPTSLGVAFGRKLERLVDREISQLVRTLERRHRARMKRRQR